MKQFLAGLGFRTATPSFDPGQVLQLLITGYNGDTAVARVGDTVLRLPEAPPGLTDTTVRIEVTSFDENASEGEATFLDRIEESGSSW